MIGTMGAVIVGSTDDADLAFALAQDYEADLVVTDLFLRAGLGLALVQRLRKELPKVNRIVFTGIESCTLMRAVLASGAQAVVSKHSPIDQLREGIEKAARSQFYACPQCSKLLGQGRGRQEAMVQLSPREREILAGYGAGLSLKEIAAQNDITHKTVCNLFTKAKQKIGIFDPAALVLYCLQHHAELTSPAASALTPLSATASTSSHGAC